MPAATDCRLSLTASTAADLMSPVVATLRDTASFHEAVALFIDRNVTIVPVVGSRGEPVGVLSLVDLLIHIRESASQDRIPPAAAADLMTPTLFAVDPDTSVANLVADMLRSKVHHLFVTDPAGTIIGVVSTCDLLRHLH